MDLFLPDSVTSKIPVDGQESTLRKISREELGYPLRADSRKSLHDELQVEAQARKISREEPEVSAEALVNSMCTKEPEVPVDFKKIPRSLPVDPSYSTIRLTTREKLDSPFEPYLGIRYMDDAEVNVGSLRRKMFKERKDPSRESLLKMSPKEGCVTDIQSEDAGQDFDVEMDVASRLMIREESQKGLTRLKDKPVDSASMSPLRNELDDSVFVNGQKVRVGDNTELPTDRFYRKVLRTELGLSMDKEKLFRGVSMDSTFRKKVVEDLDASVEKQRGMSLRDGRANAVSMKVLRDEHDVATERQRLFRDIRLDNTLDTPVDKIQRDVSDVPVETVRPKLSNDEFVVPNPGRFSQPDLTVDSLMPWTPPSDPLSHLVYDGILEKSYPNPGDLSHAVSLPLMSASSQSLVSSDGAGSSSSQSGNRSPAESRSGDKGKKTSKLKSLFKKKKDKEKDKDSKREHQQGGLQKL